MTTAADVRKTLLDLRERFDQVRGRL